MNKNDIINTLKKYNFDYDNYLVISGAAMVLLGIKEKTSDIDIAVTSNYYNHLLSEYNCKFDRTNEYGIDCFFIDDVINFSTTYYSENKQKVEFIPVQSKEDILELKLKLNRSKDLNDIKLIKEFKSE